MWPKGSALWSPGCHLNSCGSRSLGCRYATAYVICVVPILGNELSVRWSVWSMWIVPLMLLVPLYLASTTNLCPPLTANLLILQSSAAVIVVQWLAAVALFLCLHLIVLVAVVITTKLLIPILPSRLLSFTYLNVSFCFTHQST